MPSKHTMKHFNQLLVSIIASFPVCLGASAMGQDEEPAPPPAGTFDEATAVAQERHESSLQELAALRRRIADESIPLSRELNGLQEEYESLQAEYRELDRIKDSRSLDIIRLTEEIQRRKDQSVYLENTLGKYITDWGARLPVSELQRYYDDLDRAGVATQDESYSRDDVFRIQAAVVGRSIDRLEEAFGGVRFAGQSLDPKGVMKPGVFVVVGPAQFFRASDGSMTGPVEQLNNSSEPSVVAYTFPEQAEAADIVINNGRGPLPLDVTLGNARVMEQTSETITEHVLKGGPVVWPILALAAASLLTALLKWIGLSTVRNPGGKRLEALLLAVREHRNEAALEAAKAIPGPAGRMLVSGVEHIEEPKDLVEEIMYEKILATRLRVQRFLPFIAISAAAAPLLGLLGTVTGIISTFKMITLFGTGNVQTLSGGISEALITTELGLVAAIPALLLHAFLSRKAKGITDRMEQAAIAFVNAVAVAHPETSRGPAPTPSSGDGGSSREGTREALAELLRPILDDRKDRPEPGASA